MKKFGFTLAELLVAIGIIAIIAAATAPMLDRIVPDKNKAKVLKVYKTVSDINADLLSDPSLYMMDNNAEPCVGIECTDLPTNPQYSDAHYSGTSKYCYLLADKLNLATDINEIPPRNAMGLANSRVTFDTTDGLHWEVFCSAIRQRRPIVRNVPNSCGFTIRTNDENECQYGTCNSDNYNTFGFDIKNSGRLEGGDGLTRAYLANPTKLNDKKADLEKAKTLKEKTQYNENNTPNLQDIQFDFNG